MATILDAARELDALGLNVVPASMTSKKPVVEWKPYQRERTTSKLQGWLQGNKRFNLCIVTGSISGCVVLDIDSVGAYHYWHERIGEAMDATVYVASPRVTRGEGDGLPLGHYYFRIGADDDVRGRSRHKPETDMQWDLKAEGGITLVPPSTDYAWIRSPFDVEMLPMPQPLRAPKALGDAGDAAAMRSKLADLLLHPGQDGRNNWMTKIAGHYAKMHASMRDLYEVEMERAWDLVQGVAGDGEYTREEFEKTRESIWSSEVAKDPIMREFDECSGWLASSGYETMVQTRVKTETGVELRHEHWADFNMRALGVVEDSNAVRVYDVEVFRRRQKDVRRALLPAATLADGRRLNVWLAELGVGIAQPDNAHPRMAPQERLRRYLEEQDPPHFEVVDALGWHHDGFVCHEGVITADGLQDFEEVKPNPRLQNWAPYRYGFRSEAETREALREILTFHDETVASVFGSWAIACLLKPQIHEISSQFPFMALEAPSESGKTTGMFSMLMSLMGNTQGQIDPTRASLRDYVSAHQSGVVWIDDLSDTAHIMDLLRQATGEGSVSKKGEDRYTQEVVRLVAPIVISGEALQLQHQKALMDRAVMLTVPSPTKRMSLRDPSRRQWLDVIDLRQRYPDLTVMAGTLVKLTLEQAEMVQTLPDLAPPAGGRWGDKIAIVRLGARILAELTSDPVHVERVDAWAGVQDNLGSENTLTTRLIPIALRMTGWPTQAREADGKWPPTPVVLKDNTVWFHAESLARWWSVQENGRTSVRTETAEALSQQADALGKLERRKLNLSGNPNRKLWYRGLSKELSGIVVDRSRGAEAKTSGGGSKRLGVHPIQEALDMEFPANLPPEPRV